MNTISRVITELPPHTYSREQLTAAASKWLCNHPQELALFQKLSASANIGSRSFAVPIEELIQLGGMQRRAEVFHKVGQELLQKLLVRTLDESDIAAPDFKNCVFTSCSLPAIPSPETYLLPKLGFSPAMTRLPIFQHGCAGGAIGLGLANKLARPDEPTILLSMEFCSLIHQCSDMSGASLVGSALFGDGGACVIMNGPNPRLRLLATESYLIPEATHLMGYDVLDDGLHLRLDRLVPECLAKAAPQFIKNFLSARGQSASSVKWWLFHPGGTKILQTLESSLALSRSQTIWSWNVLRDHGNMSSASVLFALSEFLDDRSYDVGDLAVMLGVGPGLTLELLLFECLE